MTACRQTCGTWSTSGGRLQTAAVTPCNAAYSSGSWCTANQVVSAQIMVHSTCMRCYPPPHRLCAQECNLIAGLCLIAISNISTCWLLPCLAGACRRVQSTAHEWQLQSFKLYANKVAQAVPIEVSPQQLQAPAECRGVAVLYSICRMRLPSFPPTQHRRVMHGLSATTRLLPHCAAASAGCKQQSPVACSPASHSCLNVSTPHN